MKILLCNGEYPPFAGGGGVYTSLLARGLAKHATDAQIIVYAGTPDLAYDKKLERLGPNQIIYYSKKLWDLDFGGSTFLDVVQDFEEVIKLFQPDLIHVHHTMESLLVAMVADKHNIPFILTIQKSPVPDIEDLKKPSWTAVRFAYLHLPYAGVVATSKAYESQAIELGAKAPIRRIYYGVNVRQFRRDPSKGSKVRQELKVRKGETLVLCPSRIDFRKGIDVLIEAAKLIRDKSDMKFKVIVAGRKSPAAEEWYQFLLGLIKGYALADVVQLSVSKNAFEDMAGLYAAADICVMPSLREGLGISVIEAMATGVPVIASNTIGVDELVIHEQSGLLVPVGDSMALANAIIRLDDDPDLRETLAAGAAEFIQNNQLDYDSMSKAHIKFYAEIFEAHKAERGKSQASSLGARSVTRAV
jgi:glycosyltransferase involved in cell wall biosynthesis